MKLTRISCAALGLAFCTASAQTPAPEAAKSVDTTQLEALAKKIDEQNAKIDALSQEILKLEEQVLLFLQRCRSNDFLRLCLPHWGGLEQTLPTQPRVFSTQRE